jgi:enoyl-CoA hydratase/carnithine racemase
VVADAELASAVEGLADEILRRASSDSIAATKQLLLDSLGLRLDERLDLAAGINAAQRQADDCKRGVAHFLDHKTTPDWRK